MAVMSLVLAKWYTKSYVTVKWYSSS